MGEVPPLSALYRQYRELSFAFFIVYTREAHPGENYPHHVSAQQKLGQARELRRLERVDDMPILIDDIDGTVHSAYGQLPNMVYLIDRDGVIVYKSDWTDSHEIDGMCQSLARRDRMESENLPIIRQGRSQRLHWIPMEPAHRERIYRRSGAKAIEDYRRARGVSPYASDREAGKKSR